MTVFRRIMLGGGIDIDTLPDTQKLYYQATAKVTPQSNSLGAPLIANKYNATTGEGVIICIYNIGKIGDRAFYEDTSLTSITIGNSVTSIGNAAFGLCASMESVTIGNSVTSIENLAFYLCTSLTNVSIPDKVTSIGYAAFSGCHSLTNVTIPNSVTSIDSNAFEECELLTSITIPNSVTTINPHTFSKCTSMQYYNFGTHETIPKLYHNSFDALSSTCKIIVPDDLYDEWIIAENWSDYASNIIKKSDWDAQQVTE